MEETGNPFLRHPILVKKWQQQTKKNPNRLIPRFPVRPILCRRMKKKELETILINHLDILAVYYR